MKALYELQGFSYGGDTRGRGGLPNRNTHRDYRSQDPWVRSANQPRTTSALGDLISWKIRMTCVPLAGRPFCDLRVEWTLSVLGPLN